MSSSIANKSIELKIRPLQSSHMATKTISFMMTAEKEKDENQ